MGCPVHIWAPLMAGTVPLARVARDRLLSMRARRSAPEPPRELKRWAPVQPAGQHDRAD